MEDENVFDEIESDLDDLKTAGLGRAFLDIGIAGAAASQRDDLKKELKDLRKAVVGDKWRDKWLPDCPCCGGKCESGFEKCRNCGSTLAWVGKHPCKPGEEDSLRKKLDDEKAKKKRQANAKRQEDLSSTRRRINEGYCCPKCRKLTNYKIKKVCKDCSGLPRVFGRVGGIVSVFLVTYFFFDRSIGLLLNTVFFTGYAPVAFLTGRSIGAHVGSFFYPLLDSTPASPDRRHVKTAVNKCLLCGGVLTQGKCQCGYCER